MSEWFSSTGEEQGAAKHGTVGEVICELPAKLTQRAEALNGRQSAPAKAKPQVHGDDLQTFLPLFNGEDALSRQRRWLGLQAVAAKMEGAFEAFSRDRDRDDFQRLWVNFLLPTSPQRLLGQPVQNCSVDTHHGGTAPVTEAGPAQGAIPTLLLSTNGTSMADRLDLYGAFAAYLREQQGAYVALLRPDDLAAGVGSCFSSALAQLSGLPDSAAEDIMGLVAWYEHETGRGPLPTSNSNPDAGAGGVATPPKGAPKTPGRGAAKTPGGRGGRGKTPGGRGAQAGAEAEGAGAGAAEGTVAARLRPRRGQQSKAAVAAAEADGRTAREAQEAMYARNRQRHVVLLVEAAGRVTDRGALRALLAALHGERHRLPIMLVLGVSTPAALYASKLPADVAALLQLTAAELAPHPLQLHRLFQDVLLAPQAPPPLLLDGATMRELLLQSRLLEPSLSCLQAALLEASEQHFRREPLAPLALLPLQQHQADEAAAATASRRKPLMGRNRPVGVDRDDDGSSSSSDGDESDDSPGTSPYMSAQSKGDAGSEADLGDGPYGLANVDEAWLDRRRQRHGARLAAAISELPGDLIRTACSSLTAASSAKENGGAAARQQAATVAACEAVTEAFSALSAWRLGLRWLAVLAERTGAIQMPGGHRYALPSLYVAAASPRFWKPPVAAVAAAIAASCAGGHQPVKASAAGGSSVAAALAATSLAESLLAGVLGPTLAGSSTGKANARGTLRALPEEELDLVLDDLMDAAREALLHDWLPAATVMQAAKGLEELLLSLKQDLTDVVGTDEGPVAGGKPGAGEDETSPVRRRLAAQGLTSPPTAEKLKGVTERLGRMDPLPAPKLLQPNNAPQQSSQPARQGAPQAQPPSKPTGGTAPPGSTAAGTTHASVKLPSSGQTQSKRQRDQALLAAVQQRAAAGPSAVAAAAAAVGPAAAAASFADRAVEFLAGTLRVLLGTCPFHLPGSAAFTFRDATGLQRRLVGAPSLALHMALTEPERILTDLAPGLHPGQEDAAIAYQLLVGCRDGADLRDWLADFCAASGLGRVQEVQEEDGEDDEEDAVAEKDEGRPMGRSRTSRRRHAPRKRKAAPKQEMVLALEGSQAEAAVDEMACRFEQVARELEAVGLCRFSKRRKGLYVHRTYFPPEAVA